MKTNHLLYRADIGKIKKCTFANPPKDKVFGYARPHDPEDAGEVMQHWELSQPDAALETGPDFSGLTRADQQQPFRFAHPQTLARGIATHKPPPPLPSDANPWHTYGSPSAYRSQEQIRIAGREDPNIQQLVQGSFQWDWVAAYTHHTPVHAGTCAAGMTNSATTLTTCAAGITNRTGPCSTKAADGHAAAAARILAGQVSAGGENTLKNFKLSRFKRVAARTNTFRQQAVPALAQPVC
ncbi:hypothetical protein COCSUDRAFT_43621 [Coccomyxa subellipsoidea C-169]|uniref:Uncharacterized protein n=1 Tax=Coccomyxa subellipsoidea (strain C-169) TaxID=574566 RepID=I0YQK6_COCSC|nr:hypothetical protein COCSUDRAFT_43621 [Coccomyxa subellipsoidea C-169]EIE20675.1 hypothetical protein COCSUDRAFT_43621 [Coccomyxa subellipsoidea C-169]|eukprot:XP_005645219.1 hypothetical protein COCSUDRAFT_43621 [Coccomyxa subellipsoidea C-169]